MCRFSLPGLALSLVALIGCSGKSAVPTVPAKLPETPLPVEAQVPEGLRTRGSSLGGLLQTGDTLEGASGIYRIDVDPQGLVATASLSETRHAQATDDQYELDISIYFAPTDIKITGVTGTPTTVDVTYTISHPFAAPSSLSSPATAANRADLGISGRVLYLVDTPSIIGSTYYTGTDDVVVNTALVTNADAYYKPNDLLDTSTFLANTFPYQALVNEAFDPRQGVSNAGADAGNYNATTGWQGSNIGATRNGWTGYGVLHQGQQVTHTVSLDRTALGLGFSFDVAVLAKYTDPRGGISGVQKRANRLPSSPANIANFVYRAPHCALDVERVVDLGEGGGFLTNAISASELRFHVVDWDARATETAEADLDDDSAIQTVPMGAGGAPSLDVCIPGVLGDATAVVSIPPAALTNDDSAFGGDAGLDTGTTSDPLFYESLVTKTVTSGQVSGSYTGLVRVADPEENLASRVGWYFPLNGSVVPPLPLQGSDLLPLPVVYQAFTVQMTIPNVAPTATFSTPATVLSGTAVTHTVQVTSANDGDANPITVEIDWDGGADSFLVAGTINSPYAPLPTYTSPAGIWVNSTTTPASRTINVRFTDGIIGAPLDAPDLSTTLGANRPPQITGGANVALAASTIISGQSFTMNAGTVLTGSNVTDPEGDAISYLVYDQITPAAPKGSGAAFPLGGLGPYSNPPSSSITFTTYAADPLHPTSASASAFAPTQVGTVDPGGFIATWGVATTSLTVAEVAIDVVGNCYAVGNFTGTADFDPGPGLQNRTSVGSTDAFCVSLDPYGSYRWVQTWGGSGVDVASTVATYGAAGLHIGGRFSSLSVDFDPGAGTALRTLLGFSDGFELVLSQATGAYSLVNIYAGSGSTVTIFSIHADSSFNRVVVGGYMTATADLNPFGTANYTSAGATDGFVSCWSVPSTFQFAGIVGGGPNDQVLGVHVSPSTGAIAIAGDMLPGGVKDLDPTLGTYNVTAPASPASGFFSVLNSAGTFQHARYFGPAYAYDIRYGTGGPRIAGEFYATTDFQPLGPSVMRTSAGSADAFVAAFTTAGTLEWVSTWGGTSAESAEGLTLSSTQDLRVAGWHMGTTDFDPSGSTVNRTSAGLQDGFLLAMSSTGVYQWVANWGSTGTDYAREVAIGSSGELRITGTFNSPTVDFNPGPGAANRSLIGTMDGYVLGLHPSGAF